MMINALLHRAIIYSMGSKELNPFVRSTFPSWEDRRRDRERDEYISYFHHRNQMRYFRGGQMPRPISGAILGTSTYLHQCILPRTSRLDHRLETPLHRTEGAVRCLAWIPNRMRARSWERRSEISPLT
jgi:hypothetical protein